MSRLKQNLTIDLMIQSINEVIKSQCSLSVKDVKVLNEAAQNLYKLKNKKGKTNKQIQSEFVKVVELITLCLSSD
jgi:hypothetical protein